MRMLREINQYNHIVIDLSESIKTVFAAAALTQPGFITKGIGAALKNPAITAAAAIVAMSAYRKYINNKKFTTQLYAKAPDEKTLYASIIRDLMKTGGYKLVNTKFVDGGTLYTIRRK